MECITPGNITIKIIRYVGRTNKRESKKKSMMLALNMQLFIWKTKYMNWNVQSVCCVGGIRLFWFTQRMNEHTSIKYSSQTHFFPFIYHLLERVTWYIASTISTHTHTYTYIPLSVLCTVWLPSICLDSFHSADTWWRMRSK